MALVSFVMLLGGSMKLSGDPMALTSFANLGLPNAFATFIGAAEIAGAVGLWLRRTSMWAALGISVIMVGALYYHFAFPPLSAGIPAAVVLVICLIVVSRRGAGVLG